MTGKDLKILNDLIDGFVKTIDMRCLESDPLKTYITERISVVIDKRHKNHHHESPYERVEKIINEKRTVNLLRLLLDEIKKLNHKVGKVTKFYIGED